jgi:hypothetical protein
MSLAVWPPVDLVVLVSLLNTEVVLNNKVLGGIPPGLLRITVVSDVDLKITG